MMMSSKRQSENANTLPVILLFAWPVRWLWLIPLIFFFKCTQISFCSRSVQMCPATKQTGMSVFCRHPRLASPTKCPDFQLTLSDFSSIAGKVGSWTQCEFVLLPPTFTCFLRLAQESSDGPGWLRTSCEWHFIRTNGPNKPSCTSLSLNRLRSGCRTSSLRFRGTKGAENVGGSSIDQLLLVDNQRTLWLSVFCDWLMQQDSGVADLKGTSAAELKLSWAA